MEKRFVYADNAATTRVSDAAFEAALPYLRENFGNPSSIHSKGMAASRAVLEARQRIADAIGAKVNEVYFTSGGSEADNWALLSAAQAGARKHKKHIITTSIEHHAVLNTCKYLETLGFEVTYLPVSSEGIVNVQDLKKALRDDTCLVSVMLANNEIGTLQPVSEISVLCREKGVLLHTDAVAAIGHDEIDVKTLGVDMLSVSGHKIHAPKGIGFLYAKRGTPLCSMINGGGQEKGLRAGTENVPAIAALGTAVCEACSDIKAKNEYITPLRDMLIDGLLKTEGAFLNGSRTMRTDGNVNISFSGVEGESMILMLDMNGICASSGSACTSGALEPSHVLTAIGCERSLARGSLRLTINEENTAEDIRYMLKVIPEVITRLRTLR